MTTPAWQGAASGGVVAVNAGHINQFLGTHKIAFAYTGTAQVSGPGSSSGSQGSNGLWLAQPFTTGASQSRVERLTMSALIAGSPSSTWQVGIQTDSGGSPSGTWLCWCYVPKGFLTTSARSISIPAGIAVSSSTKYHIVAAAAGGTGNDFLWQTGTSTGVVGLTSTNGTSWSALTVTYLFSVFAGSSGQLINIAEDGAAPYTHWCEFIWNSANELGTVNEAVNVTTSSNVFDSERTLSYSNGVLTSVA